MLPRVHLKTLAQTRMCHPFPFQGALATYLGKVCKLSDFICIVMNFVPCVQHGHALAFVDLIQDSDGYHRLQDEVGGREGASTWSGWRMG